MRINFIRGVAFAALFLAASAQLLCAADPFFKPNDVVALIGGEDMAMMRDYPGLELLVVQQPGLSGVKFRILAQEGDTVFEQFRDLNFPSWEEQLRRIGATVVLSQFGKMESLTAGGEDVAKFITTYEKLLERFGTDGRRVVVVSPVAVAAPIATRDSDSAAEAAARNINLAAYASAERELAARHGWRFVDLAHDQSGRVRPLATSDGLHPAACYPYTWIPQRIANGLGLDGEIPHAPNSPLLPLLKEKNTLWFHYWRPQNWAFLAGDRTEQPSSRDHLDPTKRWFPAEMEKWLPLIAAKEKQLQGMIESARKP